MKKKGLVLSLIAISSLSACSFAKPYEEDLEDVSSIYYSQRDPAFVTLDYAIKNTFGEPYFGVSSEDFKLGLRIKIDGGAELGFSMIPKKVTYCSNGLDGNASSVKSAFTVEEADFYLGETSPLIKINEKPVSFGIYSDGLDCYYDFSELKDIKEFQGLINKDRLSGKLEGVYGERATSLAAMLPLAIESRATSFSKDVEEAYKANPRAYSVKENDGLYSLGFSLDSADELRETIMLYNAVLFATPMEIPLGEEGEGRSITITKEMADSYTERLFDGLIINKDDSVLTYETNGLRSFDLDLDLGFEDGSFVLNNPNGDSTAEIKGTTIVASFNFLSEENANHAIPERLIDF